MKASGELVWLCLVEEEDRASLLRTQFLLLAEGSALSPSYASTELGKISHKIQGSPTRLAKLKSAAPRAKA